MVEWWHYLPEQIDPIAFTVGPFFIRWYAICFILGFFAMTWFLFFRAGKSESVYDREIVWDAASFIFFGVLLGGRLGYALFYDQSLFASPFSLIFPIDAGTGSYVGIHGMSFFGALIGAVVTLSIFVRIRKIDFLSFADFLAIGAPIALFLGRLGNFLNLEIPGRRTTVLWGMYFPDPSTGLWELRHPSQLYEALAEGIVLFLVLFFIRRRNPSPGILTAVFLAGYAITRFFIEFFREPDPGTMMTFGWMTIGQTLSVSLLFAVIVAVNMVAHRRRT